MMLTLNSNSDDDITAGKSVTVESYLVDYPDVRRSVNF